MWCQHQHNNHSTNIINSSCMMHVIVFNKEYHTTQIHKNKKKEKEDYEKHKWYCCLPSLSRGACNTIMIANISTSNFSFGEIQNKWWHNEENNHLSSRYMVRDVVWCDYLGLPDSMLLLLHQCVKGWAHGSALILRYQNLGGSSSVISRHQRRFVSVSLAPPRQFSAAQQ